MKFPGNSPACFPLLKQQSQPCALADGSTIQKEFTGYPGNNLPIQALTNIMCKAIRLLWISGLILAGFSTAEARTIYGFDLSNATIPVDEVYRGCPGRDCIPAIDNPLYESVAAADKWLNDKDIVVGYQVGVKARAWPLRILGRHEIVNDTFADQEIAVTYCPLCGTAMVFDAVIDGVRRHFGVSGMLYNSDVMMFDRETESLWSQLAMKSVSGPMVDTELTLLNALHLTWAAWKERFPDSEVLSRTTGYDKNYRGNPYREYERQEKTMFPVMVYRNDLPTKAWIAGVTGLPHPVALPLQELPDGKSIKAKVGGTLIEVKYSAESGNVQVIEVETGAALPVTKAYWFAWQAFYPNTALWRKPVSKEDG
jgi:hypothetical protein